MMRPLPTDGGKTELFHVIKKQLRERGLSPQAAIGEAIRWVDKGGFDWRQHFPATANDERVLARKEGA